ncbi:rhomboid family intramembrane serine protease [Bosea psychrotolerans]|uniref:Membrane associated rhomboid family serine protease n=1 Tax=Bosea psychrotolerans TaxID=1871628 RepID=A0A2S4MBA1_9HYPH|nr:rhomboid family intramembrane serine protease [Bosea psychrotolerans]POR51767.1 membrane associated rhomboid family serine protease [Bosea psychrotolerans]
MFVPLHDGVPLRFMRAPYVTYGLVSTCLGLFLLMWLRESETAQIAVAAGFGLIPSVLFGTAQLPTDLLQAPVWVTLFSNILLHASFAHLGGNMLFLWVFGDNVEDAMGHLRFLLFFFICGLAGSLTHALMNPASDQPLIGASGAISGVIASYLMLYPRVRIWGLAFNWVPLHITALYALSGWILFQVVSAILDPQGHVGWWAHLGGLGTGAALTPIFIHRGVALFGRPVGK